MACPTCKMTTFCLCTIVIGPYGKFEIGKPLQTSPEKLRPTSPKRSNNNSGVITPKSPFYNAPILK